MSEGDKEIQLASEEVVRKNLLTMMEYSKDTRQMVRELEEQVKRMAGIIHSQTAQLENQNRMLAQLLQEKVQGGTSGDQR